MVTYSRSRRRQGNKYRKKKRRPNKHYGSRRGRGFIFSQLGSAFKPLKATWKKDAKKFARKASSTPFDANEFIASFNSGF